MVRFTTRRSFLGLLAAAPMAAPGRSLAAQTPVIDRLIREAQPLPHVSQRIDFIGGRLLGVRYRANTLIGSPSSPEKFVVRDDAFDCVTYCEVVLAAALSGDRSEFETVLRRIRYQNGTVAYDRRNHYFADWCRNNIENGICRPVPIEPSSVIEKTVSWHHEFAQKRVSILAVDRATLLSKAARLAPGDIVAFASRRPGLDYYHTGFIAFDKTGELLVRSAAQSHGRVVDERMTSFAAANPVKYVTLLRAAERAAVVERR